MSQILIYAELIQAEQRQLTLQERATGIQSQKIICSAELGQDGIRQVLKWHMHSY